jgi:uncharacterized membrane protein
MAAAISEKVGIRLCWLAAGLFAVSSSAISWLHWTTYQYHTFDLAFYVQAFWLMIHGKSTTTLLGVSILGNHAEPIAFLILPLFALFPHPILPVIVQNMALATMSPVGYRICRRLDFEPRPALLCSLALLLTPASGFVALHEFHTEAFAAPLLLLLFLAHLRGSLGLYWICFAGALACKENIALLLMFFSIAEGVFCRDRRRLITWYIAPGCIALAWFVLYTLHLGPALNRGNVEYAALYSNLGGSTREIMANLVDHPSLFTQTIKNSLLQGNLFWGVLLPLLGLPLLRPKWLFVAFPILLQHLLTWRSAEWNIYFHYGAPLIPIFWIASLEACKFFPDHLRKLLPPLFISGCVVGQWIVGPARQLAIEPFRTEWRERSARNATLALIPRQASVVAPLSYLSHLALREQLFSLHHILKGLKTLSRVSYSPPAPTDIVLIDYSDVPTFDYVSGYYHPQMRTASGQVVQSSDYLLHEWLRRAHWTSQSRNQITLLRRSSAAAVLTASDTRPILILDDHSALLSASAEPHGQQLAVQMKWRFSGKRQLIPWMLLKLEKEHQPPPLWLDRGLCLPESSDEGWTSIDSWTVDLPENMQGGRYDVQAVFIDKPRLLWSLESTKDAKSSLLGTVELDELEIAPLQPPPR